MCHVRPPAYASGGIHPITLVPGGRRRLLLSEHVVTEWEWSLLDDFTHGGALLSDAEVTFMQDLRPLQRASESLRRMADVNIINHYAKLAQTVTDTIGSESRALLLKHSTELSRCTVTI
jgi:hypothetical protein